ncbi:hypothetical protein ACIA5G_32540 [Amycolatopsis sp. NPDC051758]|uniref:hypothetical protein n=1 Tax=Amycolatopsis sp. NPDC051758 TaxID=3363935 RepID=UPI003798CE38
MLPPTDQGHLRKYLATLGVAVVVASIAVGGFILQMQNDLLVEQKKINESSEVGRLALDKKQHIILFLFQWSPFVLGALALLGVGLAGFGLKGWSRKQKVIDRKEESEAAKVQVELEGLRASEQLKAVERERAVEAALKESAREESESASGAPEYEPITRPEGVDDAQSEVESPPGSGAGESPAPEDRSTSTTAPSSKSSVSRVDARNEIMMLETTFIQKLSALFGENNVVNGAQILPVGRDADEAGIYIDAVAVDPASQQGFALELKSLRSTTPVRYYHALIQCVLAARSLRGHDMFSAKSFKPVLIIVIEDDEIGMERIGRFRHQLGRVADLFQETPKILIYTREEFMTLESHRLLYGLA